MIVAICAIAGGLLAESRLAAASGVCGLSVTGAEPQVSNGSTATGAGSLACGDSAVASANGGVAIGILAGAGSHGAQVQFNLPGVVGATAIGMNAFATGNQATAVGGTNGGSGFATQATGDNSSALGTGAAAAGVSSTAIGDRSSAFFDNSTAIGAGAVTTRTNQQSFGTATNTYTMAGVTSAASLAAQTGPVSFVTTDTAGNLAALSMSSIASASSVAALDGRVTNLESNVRTLNYDVRKAFEGAAVAIAMGGAALPDNKKFAISANWGTFSGENAFGGMAQMRISNNFVANAAVGTGFTRGGVGGRVGGTFAW
jgi:trimeric autotransporter adhesin